MQVACVSGSVLILSTASDGGYISNFSDVAPSFLSYSLHGLAHSSGWRWGASDSISPRARVGSLPNYYHTLVLESGLRVKFLHILVPATGNWSPQTPPTLLAPIHQRILRLTLHIPSSAPAEVDAPGLRPPSAARWPPFQAF